MNAAPHDDDTAEGSVVRLCADGIAAEQAGRLDDAHAPSHHRTTTPLSTR